MSVSNYTPDKGYKYSKLRNVLYLVDATHTKDIHIDNGVAYIDNLSQTPLKLEGFNITFKEEESLDERYKFQKTVTISLRGYANIDDLGERYYAIVETTDGTLYMVNIDFPSRIKHTFNLSDETNQTDFTFSSYSNYPTLRLDATIPNAQAVTCVGYQNGGLIGLKMINKDYVAISTHSNKITTYGDTFKTIDYLGKTCSFQEVFDGEKYTDTITFDIALDDYKTSWHYNLLEFMQNLYAAIISVRNSDYKYYSGFNYGLQPQVSIDVASTDTGNNSIRITLTEASVRGLIASDSIQGDESADKNWVYIKTYQGHDLWECLGQGQARYLVKQEIDALGNPTGRYMCLNGYQALFPYLNIVGTFSTTETFYEASCGGDDCQLSHGVPNTIYFDAITCHTYSLSSSCDWNIVETLPNITVSPSSGNGGERYYVQVCNTQEPTDTALVGTFNINYGGNTRIITTIVQKDEGFLRPNRVYITCNPQTVQFAYDPNCPITITSIDPQLTYTLDAGTLTVNVPRYTLTSAEKTWSIVAKNCNNEYQTVYIIQDKVYERWVATQQYMCVGGNSYVQEVRYTGATPTTIDSIVWPLEYRAGDLIQEGDARCNKVITKYEWLGNYYCINGDKIKALEQVRSTDGGLNWEKTGLTMLGETVETASTWCNTEATYSWVLTDRTQCGEDEILNYTFEYCNGQKFAFQDVPSTGGTYEFCLRSEANGNSVEWTVATACSYTHITATSTGYSVTVDENTDPDNDRECYIVLRQSGSGNRVTLNTIQQAGELQCNTLLDSCCGRGSHSDYDIQFGGQTGTTTDSVQGGCTIRMTSTLPYWLDVNVNSNIVTYRVTDINTGATRYYTVDFEKVTGPTGYCDTASVLVKQLGGAVPSTQIFRWQDGTVYKDTNPSADAGSETFSLVSTIDGVSTGYTASYSCDWVTANTSQNSSFTVNWAQNTSESSRTCRITLTQQNSSKTITLVVNQSAGEQGETYFRWGDDQHMYEYSATTTYNGTLTLVPFASKVNGVDTNAVLSSDVSWIQTYNQLYYNYNEVKPSRNETIYLDANYNEQPRTGTLTLTQKGTGDQIKVVITQAAYVADCTITSFGIADEVCIGQGLSYNFTVADTRCSRTTYFNLFQGSTTVTSTATPSGGIGNGVFQTSTLTAGTASATCVVNGQQVVKEVTVLNCGDSYWDTGLPVVVINTPNGQPITSKEVWMEGASIKIYQNRDTIVYDNSALSIRGRGNSSWVYSDKKPYALKLEKKAEILGMPSSKRWALLANYGDRILMRNQIANEIAHCTDLSTGLGWTPSGQFVELVLNGEHRGNYYLSEQVRVESNRLDIDEFSDCLYEIDRNDMDEDYTFTSAIKDYPYHIKSPDVPDVTYFKGKIDTVETLLNNGSGYKPYLDYNSFADHWIIEELTQNFECRGHSPGSLYCYYLEDSNVGKLKMGPVWDFDYSTFNLYWPLKAGNELCSGTTVPSNGYMPQVLAISCHVYYDYLFNDSEFKAVVKQRWNAIKSRLDAIANRFDYWYTTLYNSEQLNWALWPIPPDFESGHHPDCTLTFLQAKNYAKEFYTARLSYLNGVINSF